MTRSACIWLAAGFFGCAGRSQEVPSAATTPTDSAATTDLPARADVVGVRTTAVADATTFFVTIRSDETGCDQYADWWEVLTPEGELVYRRILDHSHPSEQPFERSGGPVPINADDEVIVRAHLHADAGTGYGGTVHRGSIAAGFAPQAHEDGFATDLSTAAPLPTGCAF